MSLLREVDYADVVCHLCNPNVYIFFDTFGYRCHCREMWI